MKAMTPVQKVLALLGKKNARYKFKHLLALTKLSKKELEDAIAEIRISHKNLVFAKFDKTFYLSDTPTWYSNQTDLSRVLPLEGSFGLISDTHLGSVAERLDIVNFAYDTYAARGIKQVFHCGDLTDGWSEYKGHINFVKVYGDQPQALYVIKNYPHKAGMMTYVIGGNHDDSFKHTKLDRISLVVNGFHHEGRDYKGRDDIKYLGQYAHKIIFPDEVTMEMLHPRGNGSYARSYGQQKRSENMDRNLRPDLQVSGHFHFQNHIWLSGTHFIACPGLQDETEFFKRLGLPRNVGFQIIHYRIKDGKFLSLQPELFMFT